MSISYRLAEIESAIPYDDVDRKWATKARSKWISALVEHRANGTKLAELMLELLDAFTPGGKKFLWSDDEAGFDRVREQCAKAAAAAWTKTAAGAKGLREVRRRA